MQISEAETVVMNVLWERSPLSAEKIVLALSHSQTWQETTIKTLLSRLLNKGAIRADKVGRQYFYEPVLTREAWVKKESHSFLTRVFGGQLAPLVAHFSYNQKLSEEDVAAIRQVLDSIETKSD